jgi:hypothetical protein
MVRCVLLFLTTAATATCAACLAQPALATVTYRTVALTGSPAPGFPAGLTFDHFGPPLLDGLGRVSFGGAVTPTDAVPSLDSVGLWSERSGALAIVARNTDPAPGMPGEFLLGVGTSVVNAAGNTTLTAAFRRNLNGRHDHGFWSDVGGPLELVARKGGQAPTLAAGVNFAQLRFPIMDPAGRIVFEASLETTTGGVTAENDSGVWSSESGMWTVIAREGSPAPGGPPDGRFDDLYRGTAPMISAAGDVHFSARLQLNGGSVTADNNSGLWTEKSGVLTLSAREGDQPPGTPLGVRFGELYVSTISDSGIAFAAPLVPSLGGVTTRDDTGIWAEKTGELTLIAREGNPAPGMPADIVFSDLGTHQFGEGHYLTGFPIIDDNGGVTFATEYRSAGGAELDELGAGIWSDRSGALSLIMKTGDHAPGTPTGATFAAITEPTVNSSGAIAFTGLLETGAGGVNASNNFGLWAEDATGRLTLVARHGDLLEVAPGDTRTLSALIYINRGGSVGRGTAFNNDHALTFLAGFADGSWGIIAATLTPVPEPASWVVLAGLAILIVARPQILKGERSGRRLAISPGAGAPRLAASICTARTCCSRG